MQLMHDLSAKLSCKACGINLCCFLRAAKGGGAYIGAIGATTVTQANFTANTSDLNAANGTSFGGGGALYLDSGVTLLTNNTFQDNQATGYGGALAYTFECFDPSVVPGS